MLKLKEYKVEKQSFDAVIFIISRHYSLNLAKNKL
jgi:hypothetical protein